MDGLMKKNRKKLGFGLMRLPKDADGALDVKRTIAMVDRFIEEGFTYFDTAYVYPGSEEIFRKAIGSRHRRDSYTLASKLSGWALSADGLTPQTMFERQLERTGLDYFDFYLLHNVNKEHLEIYDRNDCWTFCEKLKREGKIKHFGFSLHDTPEFLDKVLTEHPEVDFVQLQINYLDWNNARVQSKGVYETARKHNKPIVIMEPVKGGMLADLDSSISAPLFSLGGEYSPSAYALRFAASLDGVLAVLSGMSTEAQLEENLKTFSPLVPLTERETRAIKEVREAMERLNPIQCTACRYCTDGCPEKIAIPDIFRYMNEAAIQKDKSRARSNYANMIKNGKSGAASSCIKCGKCEKVCPQRLPIRSLLEKAESILV